MLSRILYADCAPCIRVLQKPRHAKTDFTAVTTFSGVKPKCLNKTPAGADSPKVSMPTTAPSRPTYLRQKSVTPASTATRGTPLVSTLALYAASCQTNTTVLGMETTRTGLFCVV